MERSIRVWNVSFFYVVVFFSLLVSLFLLLFRFLLLLFLPSEFYRHQSFIVVSMHNKLKLFHFSHIAIMYLPYQCWTIYPTHHAPCTLEHRMKYRSSANERKRISTQCIEAMNEICIYIYAYVYLYIYLYIYECHFQIWLIVKFVNYTQPFPFIFFSLHLPNQRNLHNKKTIEIEQSP